MNKVLMPEFLTEAQLNELLSKEKFRETVADISCPECGGPQASSDEDCPQCNGHGIVRIFADITPETAAGIYALAVALFKQEESKIITLPS